MEYYDYDIFYNNSPGYYLKVIEHKELIKKLLITAETDALKISKENYQNGYDYETINVPWNKLLAKNSGGANELTKQLLELFIAPDDQNAYLTFRDDKCSIYIKVGNRNYVITTKTDLIGENLYGVRPHGWHMSKTLHTVNIKYIPGVLIAELIDKKILDSKLIDGNKVKV